MLSGTPAASVILCVYNGERYLRLAIDSILNQTFSDFELIIINDGSTDASGEIISKYTETDQRCTSVTTTNRGVVASRNLALDMAKSDIVFIMDADDYCSPDRLSKQMEYLTSHTDCVGLGSAAMLIDPDGRELIRMDVPLTHEAIDQAHMSGLGGAIMNPSAVVRKSAALKVGGYREECQHAEDIDLWLRLAEVGKLANLSEILLSYRQHLGSIGYAKRREQLEGANRAVAYAHARRGLASQPKQPMGTTAAVSEIYAKWSWWALMGGNLKTGRIHGWNAFKSNPLNLTNFRLFYCLIRGY